VARKYRARAGDLIRRLRPVGRLLLKSRLLIVFLALCVAGIAVGLGDRPDPSVVPYDELFREMSVVSSRESPSDTTAHFAVDLCAGGRAFARYDVDAATFGPPPRDRDYDRAITGTVYRPLEVRGHVAQGLWLDVPRLSRLSFLPEQFDELYRATLDFVKPVSLVAGAVGTLSGYSVGYRLGIWNSSLRSRAVQARILATPGLGRSIAREAWRRVLLEPLVMGAEEDAQRFATTSAVQRIYGNFFRLALDDSDGFIPREAARLASLGHAHESRAMLAFAAAVERAQENAPVTSADFDAVERWASLLVRRGHWANDAIPPAGEERARYLGTLAWYGVAPPTPKATRIWIGPRLLVREGDTEGFVADDVPATGVGCPVAWRAALDEPSAGTNAWAIAWFADHPEFRALTSLAARAAGGVADRARQMAARRVRSIEPAAAAIPGAGATILPVASSPLTVVPVRGDSSARPVSPLHLAGDTAHTVSRAPAESLRSIRHVRGDPDSSVSLPAAAESTKIDSIAAH